jgi:hypothetical protein
MNTHKVNNLRYWCTTHLGSDYIFGFRGVSLDHPNGINITLINQSLLMFNFHVHLYKRATKHAY